MVWKTRFNISDQVKTVGRRMESDEGDRIETRLLSIDNHFTPQVIRFLQAI